MSLASQSFFKYVCFTLTHASFDQLTQSFEQRRDFTDPGSKKQKTCASYRGGESASLLGCSVLM